METRMEAAARLLALAGRQVEVDAQGYLLDPGDWDEALAAAMANADGLVLDARHWQVLRLLRDYHAEHGKSPAMRLLVAAVAESLGSGRADSRALYRLFPQGPAKQAARYAGLPRPSHCL
jgi:tRNA 2-thiouridine synthesizing protein E